MIFFVLTFILSFFIFLFCIYILARDELILVRKNITLEILFNFTFYTVIISLFFSRLTFVLLHPSKDYLNPLVFLLFPYFPGLSLIGATVSGAAFIFLYGKIKKWPSGKIFDFFSLAFLVSLPLGFFGSQLSTNLGDIFSLVVIPFSLLVSFLFFLRILVPISMRNELKDGSLGFIFLIIFSFILLFSDLIRDGFEKDAFFKIENLLLVLILVFSLIFIFLQERGGRKKKLEKKNFNNDK